MTMLRPEHLIGGWRLTSWDVTTADAITYPFGDDAEGLLTYTPDGWMQATVVAAGRPRLSHPSPRRVPDAELAAAARDFFSYAGRWHLEDTTVVHEVLLSANPEMVGTRQRRHVRLEGRSLTLSADEPVGEHVRHHRLAWHRAEPSEEHR